jgi:thiosulfate reductase cytochrome b subunit
MTQQEVKPQARKSAVIHPAIVRVNHWLNVLAMLIMVFSGWQIYNASPLFGFSFPLQITLGGWLAAGLQWHFAAMWLLLLNGLAYLLYGTFSGHYRRHLLPFPGHSIVRTLGELMRGRLVHEPGVYNPLQRAAYLGVLVLGAALVLSGLAIWKPVQLQELTALMGGYDSARIVHFICMSLLVLFVLIHVVMVLLVPRTFLPMLTGRAKIKPREAS